MADEDGNRCPIMQLQHCYSSTTNGHIISVQYSWGIHHFRNF